MEALVTMMMVDLEKDLGIDRNMCFILPLIVRGQKRPRPERFFDSAGSSFFPLEPIAALFHF
jgi:hypothetical protein